MAPIEIDSPSVQSHLTILQSIINRMAANSTNSKAWCIGIVSAISIVLSDNPVPKLVWISSLPILLFLFLDSYYLSLERKFRNLYSRFIKKLHYGEAKIEDLYISNTKDDLSISLTEYCSSFKSPSIWPFYTMLTFILIIIDTLIIF